MQLQLVSTSSSSCPSLEETYWSVRPTPLHLGRPKSKNIDAATFRGLIEVGSDGAATDNRKGNKGFGDALVFGGDDGDGDGIKIDGPKISGSVGKGTAEIEAKQDTEDKVIDEKWRPFYDPDNKNIFGQTFPAPEEVPKIPKRPGMNFPEPEPERPITGGHGGHGSNGGFEFPSVKTDAPVNGGHGGNGGFEQQTQGHGGHSGNGGFEQQTQGHGGHAGNGGFEQQTQGYAGNGGFEVTESWINGGHSGNGGFEQQTQGHGGHAGNGGFEVTESWNDGGHSGNGGFEQQTQGHGGHAGNDGFEQQTQGHAGNGGFEVTESWNNGGHSGNGGFEQQTQGHGGHAGNGGFEVTESWNNGGYAGNGGFEVTESWNNGGHLGNGGFVQGGDKDNSYEQTETSNGHGGHGGHGGFDTTYKPTTQKYNPCNGNKHGGIIGGILGGWKDKLHGCTETNNGYEDKTESSNGHGGHNGHSGFETTYKPTTQKYNPCNGNKHGGIIVGILGGWKDKLHGCTESNNGYEDKTENSNGHKLPGHGGFQQQTESSNGHYPNNGGNNGHDAIKDSVDKAVNSVKEAGEKVVEAGKDVVEAGWKIGQSLPGIGKHLSKDQDSKKHGSLFPSLWGHKY
ncbi:PE-PGRS family protein PE_PGRS47-like [Nasonia vitripennis]|uniref:Uncharacterized protein n=1 Tax=Nasonia vitripennis TaxID=7425 RepID=A0A7M7QBY8_NASVI|nr:PE-PGRS family protein PE_PGRS47-like [Nasonia vitripennis]